MARLTAVRAEACVGLAAALLRGERALGYPGSIQVHGGMGGGAGSRLADRRSRHRERPGGKWKTGRLGRLLGAGVICGRLVVLHRNSRRLVGLERSGNGALGSQLKPDAFLQLYGKRINERVVRPPGNERVDDVLKRNC